ncbi:hypothetical protein A374_14985 [Fictibacillus macauensis ZFHKF-1]|uniref:Uncharacterized protein n=1 Tax=Fictibacillus macauensis ZFHKF-1 TaxID=1196324 RepID=I8UCX4_9BACL|nr:DUF6143 family protein [Fictibacillus macauensis]EIT84643.1 hypothetical protein A374_14985 [Fictibacillus macauensis ZFHKF-1]
MENRMYPYGPGAGGYPPNQYPNVNVNQKMVYPDPNMAPAMKSPPAPNGDYCPSLPDYEYKNPKKEQVSPVEEKANGFLGVTNVLSICPCPPDEDVWAALVNPNGSRTKLSVQSICISNFSCYPLVAHIYFRPTLPVNAKMSSNITPADLSMSNARPKGQIHSGLLPNHPVNGVKAAIKIVPSNETISIDVDERWVVGAGTNIMVFLTSHCDDSNLKSTVSFEWQEQ